MDIVRIIIWGLAATIVLTIVLAASKPLGWSRMDLPFMLGTLFTPNRNRAPFYGFLAHLVMGWFFAFLYAIAFESLQLFTWWLGVLMGFVHALFVLTTGLQILNAFHPRMARPYQGPTPTRQLQPPGFFALNYGAGTPVITVLAHLFYGAMLGGFYR